MFSVFFQKIKLSRRKFLSCCGKLLATVGMGGIAAGFFGAKKSEAAEAACPEYLAVRHLRQIVTADSSSSRTIMWEADGPQEGVVVELRRISDGTAAKYPSSCKRYADEYFFCAYVDNLAPNEEYDFRIVFDDAASDWQWLQNANGERFKMLVFCDSQCVDYGVWGSVLKAAAEKNPDAKIFTVIGDLVDNGAADWQWRAWFDAAANVLAQKIFVPVIGNHECYDLNWQNSLPEGYLRRFFQPPNKSRDFEGYYYSFDFGAAHFIVLNTQMKETDGLRAGLLEEQIARLKKDSAKHKKPWQIVLMHKDIIAYDTGEYDETRGGINEIGAAFMATFDALGIDLVLTGHEHTYRNRGHIFRARPAERGPYYIMCGLSGDQRYPNIWRDPVFDKKLAPQPETDNYLTLDVSPKTIHIRCFLTDGKIIDDVILEKGGEK